jgi:hypothetical protein
MTTPTTAPTTLESAVRTLRVVVVPGFGFSDLNPLNWLGDAASEAVGQAWTSAMIAAWSSGTWVLGLAFTSLDAFTTPNLAADGPMGAVYPVTFGIGLVVALAIGFTQIGVAAVRRDGASLARVLIGVVQFGAVWLGYVGIAAALVTTASRLTSGLLESLLGIGEFTAYTPAADWPEQVTDTVTATVLGLCSWLLIWPAALMHILIMVVREAALLLLVATSPIAAGGLLSEVGRAWFWKSLRWLVAALLIAPLSALVLGVGTRFSQGVLASTTGTGSSGQGSEAATVGMAVVGSVLLLVGALCPLILFRLLAFVDPGTSSGAAMRSSLASHGGLSGVLKGHSSPAGGSSVAAQGDGAGRSAGEATGEAATSSRFAATGSGAGAGAGTGGLAGVGAAAGAAAGVVAAGVAAVGKVAHGAVAVGSDVLSSTGVGHAHPYYVPYPADPRPRSNGTAPALGPAAPSPPTGTSGGTPSAVVGSDSAGAPPTPQSQDPQPHTQSGSDDTGTTTTGGPGSAS